MMLRADGLTKRYGEFVALDGVSLTVAAAHGRRCEVALIPHTLAVTTVGGWASGRRVNVEVDLLARYVARLMEEAGIEGRFA